MLHGLGRGPARARSGLPRRTSLPSTARPRGAATIAARAGRHCIWSRPWPPPSASCSARRRVSKSNETTAIPVLVERLAMTAHSSRSTPSAPRPRSQRSSAMPAPTTCSPSRPTSPRLPRDRALFRRPRRRLPHHSIRPTAHGRIEERTSPSAARSAGSPPPAVSRRAAVPRAGRHRHGRGRGRAQRQDQHRPALLSVLRRSTPTFARAVRAIGMSRTGSIGCSTSFPRRPRRLRSGHGPQNMAPSNTWP